MLASILCLAGGGGRALAAGPEAKVLRAGIIGLDTSHVTAFTKTFNDPKAGGDLAGIRVVAAFPGGSPDIASSRERVAKFTEDVRGMGVEIVDSIPALLAKVDVVMLESLDGRPHWEQARQVFEAGKPLFIDKPLAASLADVIAIDALARRHHVPWFSSSSLRFSTSYQAFRHDAPAPNEKVGDVTGCDTWGPCHLEPTHPDLFWYGIHGVEILYTIMGGGCETVTRVQAPGAEFVVGVWKGGRVGSFRGIHQGKADYGATIFGSKSVVSAGNFEGYTPLVEQIGRFFKTGRPPVPPAETLELYAFMEAADESKRQGFKPVSVEAVMAKARREAEAKVKG